MWGFDRGLGFPLQSLLELPRFVCSPPCRRSQPPVSLTSRQWHLRRVITFPTILIVTIGYFNRKIIGWVLNRRCRVKEWASTLRQSLLTSSSGCT